MSKRWTRWTTAGIGAVGLIAAAVWAADAKIPMGQVPAEVKATILAEGGQVEDVEKQTDEGKTIYEADVIKDGKEIELRVAPDGKLVSRKIEGDAKKGQGEEEKEGKERKHDKTARAAKALAQAKITLAEAAEIAVKQSKGAKPVKAELEIEEGKTIFDIELLQGEKGPEMEIDAISGAVLKIESVEEQEKEDAEEKEGDEDHDEDHSDGRDEEQEEAKERAEAAKALPMAKLTMAEAIMVATKEVKGSKAFSAELEMEEGKARYEIKVLDGHEVVEVEVDAASGSVIEVERPKKGKDKDGEDSEARAEARACEAGAKNLAQAKVTMAEAIEIAVKQGKGAKPFKADLEFDEGKLMFDIELLDGEKGPEMEIDAISGAVLKIESVEEQEKEDAEEKEGDEDGKEEQQEARQKAVAAKALPATKVSLAEAVKIAVAQGPAGQAFSAVLKPEDGQPRYEIQVVAGDKCMEVVVDGITGKVEEIEVKGGKPSKAGKGSAGAGGFRDSFDVDKANLVPTGKNPYFSLEPGHKAVYREGSTLLTITVLNETKVVDGVTTRIVEEREEKNGKLEEISRNYFAIDKTTNSVYYFGEDVDEYEDGQVSHGGSWWAGKDGAKFGLMMPAKPQVRDKFYQELAPKVAMDRAEIISLDAELTTPAGTFKCVYVKETSSLERGTSHKWYAQGVGLVKDDGFVIAGPEKAKD